MGQLATPPQTCIIFYLTEKDFNIEKIKVRLKDILSKIVASGGIGET